MTRPTDRDPAGRERTSNTPTTKRVAPDQNFVIATTIPVHHGRVTLTTPVNDAVVGITTSYEGDASVSMRGPFISSRRLRDLAAALHAHADAIDDYEQERDA